MKKMSAKMGLSLLLCACVMTMLFSGCSTPEESTSTDAPNEDSSSASTEPEEETPSEPPVVTGIIQVGTMPPEDNVFIEEIRKQSGIDFQCTLVSTGDYDNRVATLTASQDLPNLMIISGSNRFDFLSRVENGTLLELDALVQEHGPEIVANKEAYFGAGTIDGKLYGLPSGGTEAMAPGVMAIRQDWLNALGLEVPETTEEFFEVMRAFTFDDPDGNGEQDTIGYGMGINNMGRGIYEAFDMGFFAPTVVDGEVVPSILNPNYLDMVKYLNEMYKAGVIEPDFVTMPWLDVANRLWIGDYGAFAFSPIGTTNNWMSRYTEDPKPEFVYTILRAPGATGGAEFTPLETGSMTVINADTENPEAAMQLLNYFCTIEGNTVAHLGLEGTHFEYNDDGSTSWLPPYDEDIAQQRNEGGTVYPWFMDRTDSAALTTFNQVTVDAIAFAEEFPLETAVLFDQPQVEVDSGSILTDIENEAFASLVVTNGDIESEYETFVQRYLQSGGEEWVEQATEIYNNQ